MNRDSPEVLSFIRDFYQKPDPTHRKIAEAVNAKFGLSFTRDSMKNFAQRRGLNGPVDEVAEAQDGSKDLQTRIDREKAEIVKRVEQREYSRLLRERAKLELVCDTLRAGIAGLPTLEPVTVRPVHDGPYDDEHAVLMLSDCHIGYRLTRDQAVGLWEYDYSVFKRYLHNLADKLAQIFPRHNYRIPVLHLHFLGDITDGALTYIGQQRSLDLSMMQQSMAALDQFTWFIRDCLLLVDTVECDAVWGNHPRVGQKGEVDPADNFDVVAYNFLKIRFENEPRVKWNVSEAPFLLTNICGWTQALMHGDRIPRHLGIPWYGITRHNQNLVALVDDLADVHIDTVEMGHFHEPAWLAMRTWGGCYINGSFTGATDLSIHGMQKATQPLQWLYGISPERAVTWDYKLTPHDRLVRRVV